MGCFKQLFYKGQSFTYDLVELGEYYLEYERLDGPLARGPARQSVGYSVRRNGLRPGKPDAETDRPLRSCRGRIEVLRFYETDRAVITASSETGTATHLLEFGQFLASI